MERGWARQVFGDLEKRVVRVGDVCSHYFYYGPNLGLEDTCEERITKELECGHTVDCLCYQRNSEVRRECVEFVKKRLECGHEILVLCKDKDSRRQHVCRREVMRTLSCQHAIFLKCYEDVSKYECPRKQDKTLKCGHRVISCADDEFCDRPVQRRHSVCGHYIEAICSGEDGLCEAKCKKLLECGHICQMRCAEKCKCVQPCEKVLDCGHACKLKCWEVCTCEKPCEKLLDCGHVCKLKCGEACFCEDPCGKLLECGHVCQIKCGEECRCDVMVERNTCWAHKQLMPCHVDPDDIRRCEFKVEPYFSSDCLHSFKVPCYLKIVSPDKLLLMCDHPCGTYFDPAKGGCGHICTGTCGPCQQGRFHVRCQEKCGKELLCGHMCQGLCCATCPPCQEICQHKCKHGACKKLCGEPCSECWYMCDHGCPHSKCSEICSAVCNHVPCLKKCSLKLRCGHPCMGFCGELCPPYCRICDPDVLQMGIFTGEELTDDLRFIQLENCMHVLESKGLEEHIKAKVYAQEISMVRCPLCRNVIVNLKRFSKLLDINRIDKKNIFNHIYGSDEENNVLRRKYLDLLKDVEYTPRYKVFDEFLLLALMSCNTKLNKAQINTYGLFYKIGRNLEEIYRDLSPYLNESRQSIVYEKVDEFLKLLQSREVPLIRNEREDINRELLRLNDLVVLMKRMAENKGPEEIRILRQETTKSAYQDALKALFVVPPYTEDVQKVFLQHLAILDFATQTQPIDERTEIVTAFNPQLNEGGGGKWYKCKNGHTYLVGECGRAMQIAKCPEIGCEETIGGEEHRLVADNAVDDDMQARAEEVVRHHLNPPPPRRRINYDPSTFTPASRGEPVVSLDWAN